MDILLVTVLMTAALFLLLLTGQRLAFVLGGIGAFFAIFAWGRGGMESMAMVFYPFYNVCRTYQWVTIPLFIFMGVVFERSGIGDDLFEMVQKWLGGIRGGLGAGTMLICIIIAALSGISFTATAMLGIIALPPLLKRGYDKRILTGLIQAGGTLGELIPPSILFIIYGMIARVSIGKLLVAGVMPGLLIGGSFIAYILIRCRLQPELGPVVPKENRASWREKFTSLRSAIMPGLVIIGVMASIVGGFASISEAASIGAAGALLCCAVHRRLSWDLIKYSVERTLVVTCLCMWICAAGCMFGAIYDGLGAASFIGRTIGMIENRWVIIGIIQATFFIMGTCLDDTAILLITAPVYLPLVVEYGFDPVWFGVLYGVNMTVSYLTPPFGYNLFVMRGVAPPEITLRDIYMSVIPFVVIQLVCLFLIVVFPEIALWLPHLVFGT